MKLHLGCGKRDFGPSWTHIDKADYPHIQYHGLVFLPFEDNVAEIIYASHVLEYFDREEVMIVLKEWRRVLKTGGILRLAVPDFETMAVLYAHGQFGLKFFLGPLYGKMVVGEETIYHKTVYDFDSLKEVLETAGFSDVHCYNWRTTEHSHIDDHSQAYLPHMDKKNGTPISLNVECKK